MKERKGKTLRVRKKLGEMLIDAEVLNEDQLRHFLDEQKKTGMKLGKLLIQQGILSETQMVDLLSQQLKIEKYHPDKYPVDLNLAQVFPADIAQKSQVAPLKKKGRLLTIAMTDPVDINALDFIEALTNEEVETVVCTEREFNQLVGTIYGVQSGLGTVMESMEIDAQPEVDKDSESKADEIQLSSLQDMAGDAPVVKLVNSIFAQAIRENASDIHISPQHNSVQIRFRVDGKLTEVPSPPKSIFLPIVARVKILANLDITISRIPQDGRFTLRMDQKEINVRVSTLPTIYGENLVLRLLDTSAGIYTLDRLGMSEKDQKKIDVMINKPYGLILSTGPTGSGKSTTLASMIDLMNTNRTDQIMTIEDPIEYHIEGVEQTQVNEGNEAYTFANGLRSIVRQDPDIIMVGEIRDLETVEIAVQASLTGHLVFSTLHTNDATGALTRLVDMGVEPFLIASSLLAVLAQRLVRRICPDCKEPFHPEEATLEELGLPKDQVFYHGRGCEACMQSGYRGRTGIFELLVMDNDTRHLLTSGADSVKMKDMAVRNGMATLFEDGLLKVKNGMTTLNEVLRVTQE